MMSGKYLDQFPEATEAIKGAMSISILSQRAEVKIWAECEFLALKIQSITGETVDEIIKRNQLQSEGGPWSTSRWLEWEYGNVIRG